MRKGCATRKFEVEGWRTRQGPVPRLAGRSPSYLFRQLYDFRTGSRHGKWSPLTQDPVANLTTDEMLNIAAYLASLEP